MKSAILCLTLVLAVGVSLTSAAVAGDEVEGYTNLGEWNSGSTRNSRTTYYYLSNYANTQSGAYADCINTFGGQLMTPLNKVDHNNLQAHLINKYNGPVWTAGMYSYGWIWLTTQTNIPVSQLIWAPQSQYSYSNGYGLAFLPTLGNTGLTNLYSTGSALRYVCQV